MKAIITAGGKGTRMRPLTFSSNKHFILLANKPLIFYAIETVVAAGIKEIGINYNPGQLGEIKGYLGDGKKWGVRITYILQEEPLGLAHIIKSCKQFVNGNPFLMHLGDNIFYGGIKSLVEYFLKKKPDGLVPIVRHSENWRLGVPYFNKKGKLVKYVEKPKNPPHDFAIPGLYFFDKNVFKCFSGKDKIQFSARGELEISSPYQWLIDHGYEVETQEFRGTWKDPGKFDDWLDTNRFILDVELEPKVKSKIDGDVKIKGKVKIGKNCKIKDSILSGPLVIGDGVIVKDSFIGPYSSIDDNCQIIKARIENSILMNGVHVKYLSKPLESSLVGQKVVIEGNHHSTNGTELFVGDCSVLKL